jgi:hypothetical protein
VARGRFRWGAFALGILGFVVLSTYAAGEPAKDDHVSAVGAIVEAARRSRVVLIGEQHGSPQLHRFLRRLVSDESLRHVVDDVVVEFGNSRYQAAVDAYIAGRPVPRSRIRPAWELTTQGSVWLDPVYEAFFRSVRARNRGLAPSQQLRVLLGDPPITPEQLRDPRVLDLFVVQRDLHLASVIQREVIARGRRAIVIAGAGHVFRRPARYPTLSNILEKRTRCEVDPAASRAGIDWCADANSFPAVSTHVIVAGSALGYVDTVERRRTNVAKLVTIAGTDLARLPVPVSGDGRSGKAWTLGKAADGLLVLRGV